VKFKLINLNIWIGGKLLDPALDFISKENPDILTLQEVYDGKDQSLERRYRTMEVLKSELSYRHAVFAPAFLDTRSIGNIKQGNAIFSKFPIISHATRSFDVPYGPFDEEHATNWEFEPSNIVHSVVDVGSTRLNVFNVHGIWGLDGMDNKRRLAMSDIIVSEVKDKENVIFAGDFNVNPNTETIGNIEKHLRNVFRNELKTTFNMKRKEKPGYATSVVDMIFTSKNIEVLNHTCPQVDISDHLPLVCEFNIN